MTLTVALTLGVLLQVGGKPQPVRVWRADSVAFVELREPGNVMLLQVDAIGRVRVLFPSSPGDSTAMSNDAPIPLALPPEAQANPATILAVRSRWGFDFTALQLGAGWNYEGSLLLQPTGGDPLAALLDIADRVTDGRPYEYGVATYARDGAAVARGPVVPPAVCLSCARRVTSVAAAAPAAQTNAVDCTNASLTNSFCGVGNAPVTITSVTPVAYQPTPAPVVEPVYVPYFLPLVVHRGLRGGGARFERNIAPRVPAAQPSAAIAFPMPHPITLPYGGRRR
jgi:hypothetical protein